MPLIPKNPNMIKNVGEALNSLNHVQGKVGWFPQARYPDGTSVAYVASIHEYGAPSAGIPPRPFMRPTIRDNQSKWAELVGQGAKAIVRSEGGLKAEQVMDMIGMKAAGDIAKSISRIQSPPLKPATIKAKLRDKADRRTIGNIGKPLIDTGIMFGSITNTVEKI